MHLSRTAKNDKVIAIVRLNEEAPSDALDVGCQVMNALQRLVSRHMNPMIPTVVTVGFSHAGKTFNVIPGEAEIRGTTKTFDQNLSESWPERIDKIVRGICRSMGADYEFRYTKLYPPLCND